jgi:hypothetical protein
MCLQDIVCKVVSFLPSSESVFPQITHTQVHEEFKKQKESLFFDFVEKGYVSQSFVDGPGRICVLCSFFDEYNLTHYIFLNSACIHERHFN